MEEEEEEEEDEEKKEEDMSEEERATLLAKRELEERINVEELSFVTNADGNGGFNKRISVQEKLLIWHYTINTYR